MDELANPAGPRKEFVNNHCSEFMQFIKVSRCVCLMVNFNVEFDILYLVGFIVELDYSYKLTPNQLVYGNLNFD